MDKDLGNTSTGMKANLAALLCYIPFVNLLMVVILPLSLILYIILMIKSYQGEKMKLPGVGDLAE